MVTKKSRCLVTTPLSKKSKRKHVALSKVKMDCCCCKLSPFFCQVLSAVGESKRLSPHFWVMLPVAKTPWKASLRAVTSNACCSGVCLILRMKLPVVERIHPQKQQVCYGCGDRSYRWLKTPNDSLETLEQLTKGNPTQLQSLCNKRLPCKTNS